MIMQWFTKSLSECQSTHDSPLNLCQLSMTSLMYRYRPTGFNSTPSECELSGGCGLVGVRNNHCATSITLGQGCGSWDDTPTHAAALAGLSCLSPCEMFVMCMVRCVGQE